MAVYIIPRRLLRLFYNAVKHRSKFQTKFKPGSVRDGARNLSSIPFNRNNADPILYKMNLAHFHNGSKPLNNVSTYENLVNQKSQSTVDKKCSSDHKQHPGRHRFHQEIEAALNDQVQVEFNAAFAYLSMASYYGRTEVALPGCQGYFMMMHEEEHEHAIIFLNYILMRGGHVKIPTICPPEKADWKDITKTFAVGVEMESQVKEKLEALVDLSEKHKDYQLIDFISSGFLEEQNKSIQIMARLMARSKMAKNDVGEYLFDQHLYDSFVKHTKDNLMYVSDLPPDADKKVYK